MRGYVDSRRFLLRAQISNSVTICVAFSSLSRASRIDRYPEMRVDASRGFYIHPNFALTCVAVSQTPYMRVDAGRVFTDVSISR